MAFSGSGAGQGAAQGAQAGMTFGPWGAIIGAGVGAIAGGLEGGKAEKAAKKLVAYQNKLVDQQRALRNEQNKLLLQETARASAEIMKDRAYALRATSEAVNYINRTSIQQKADISVQNATADAIGASAAIQYSAADALAGEAEAQQWLSQEVTMDNLQSSMASLLRQAKSMVNTTAYSHTAVATDPTANTQAILGLANAAGSMYSQGTFKNFSMGKGGAKPALDSAKPITPTTTNAIRGTV